MAGDAGKDLREPSLGVDVVEPGGGNQTARSIARLAWDGSVGQFWPDAHPVLI